MSGHRCVDFFSPCVQRHTEEAFSNGVCMILTCFWALRYTRIVRSLGL